MNRRTILELVGLCGLLLVALIGGRQQLAEGLAQENRLTAKRLERAFMPLLSKAHRANDDLALQEIVTALAQAPGVGFACVLDPSEKSVAHSRLDQLGKAFAQPRGDATRIVNVALKEESVRWGTLLFSLSTNSTDTLHQKISLQALGFGGLLVAFFLWQRLDQARRFKKQESLFQDEQAIGVERTSQIQRLESRLKSQQQDLQTLVSCVLDRTREPAILLDKRQRVAGINAAAVQLLNLPPEHLFIGLSWQDVPLLQDQGDKIEQALGQPVLFELQPCDASQSKTSLRVYR